MNQRFDQARRPDKRSVDDCLEQNGIGKRRIVEAAQEGHLVGNEHHLADDQRTGRRDEEACIFDEVLLQKQPLSEKNQVEIPRRRTGSAESPHEIRAAAPTRSWTIGSCRSLRVCLLPSESRADQKLILVPASRYLPLTGHASARGFRPGSAHGPFPLGVEPSALTTQRRPT